MAVETAPLAADARGLEDLKRIARQKPDAAAKAAAIQFEQVFVQMLLKSMRDATPHYDPLAGEGGKMFQGMLDSQWAQAVAKRGIGLAPVIEKQLARTAQPQAAVPAAKDPKAQGFVDRMLAPATSAGRATGLPPAFILGQAALESGWGAKEIRNADGTSAHNLFGIKAGAGWKGDTVDVTTTDYANGAARKVVQKFRAYGSYDEAFADYARLLRNGTRYADALASGHDAGRFANAMQQAGYATDPAYARKLASTIRRTLSVSA